MKQYELTVLIRPELETDLEPALKKVRDIITGAGGTIAKEDNWGKKKLAYSIAKGDFAIYVFFDLELPADAPLKISNTLNITDELLRYLLVKTDPKVALAVEAAAAAKSDDTKEA